MRKLKFHTITINYIQGYRTTAALIYSSEDNAIVDDWLSALPGPAALRCRADQAGAVWLVTVG